MNAKEMLAVSRSSSEYRDKDRWVAEILTQAKRAAEKGGKTAIVLHAFCSSAFDAAMNELESRGFKFLPVKHKAEFLMSWDEP